MPLIQLTVNTPLDANRKTTVMRGITDAVAEVTGKPCRAIMVTLREEAVMMNETEEPAAFVSVRAIGGLHDAVNDRLTKAFSDHLTATLAIPRNRIFVTFTNIRGYEWGWNGSILSR